jgi:hypothetical protein
MAKLSPGSLRLGRNCLIIVAFAPAVRNRALTALVQADGKRSFLKGLAPLTP